MSAWISTATLLLVACTAESAPGFRFEEANPVLRRRASGWDSGLIDPGAVVYHDGRFHMLFNAIPEWPHPLSVGYASSDDGVRWERRAEPVLSEPPEGAWTLRATSVLVQKGTWILYLSVGEEERALQGTIHRATASSPDGPWTLDDRPVLGSGEPGSWDERSVGEAKVLATNDGYVMYFTGYSTERANVIGRATSHDGIHWVKDADPALRAGPEGSWDAGWIKDPSVLRNPDGTYLMVYASAGGGRSGLGVARSGDGIRWRKDRANPIVTNVRQHSLGTIFYSNFVRSADRLYLFFEASSADSDNTDVYLMTR